MGKRFNVQMAQYKKYAINGVNTLSAINSIKSILPSLNIYGNTTQDSYQGYNLLNEDLLTSPTDGTVDLLIDNDGNKHYEITKPDSTGAYAATYTGEIVDNIKSRLVAGSWGLVHSPTTVDCTSIAIAFLDDSDKTLSQLRIISNVSAGKTYFFKSSITAEKIALISKMKIVHTGPMIFQNLLVATSGEIDLSSPPAYQPYVGGRTSPNPDYPQPIRSSNYSRLPSGLQEVEYIEATSRGPFIDLEFIPNQDTRVLCKFQALATTANYPFGVRTSSTSNVCYISAGASAWNLRFGATGSYSISGVSDTKIHTIDMSKKGIIWDAVYNNNPVDTSFTAMGNMYLLSANLNGSQGTYMGRIYYTKIYSGDTLIRDLVPCFNVSSGVVGMYDLVDRRMYTNKGTGKFTAGPARNMLFKLRGSNLFNIYTFEGKDGVVINDDSITFLENTADVRYNTSITFYPGTYVISADSESGGLLIGGDLFADQGSAYGWVGGTTKSRSFSFSKITTRQVYVVKTTDVTQGTIRNPMITMGNVVRSYEPYSEPSYIDIPSSILLDNGKIVNLSLSKIDTYYDKLVVNSLTKKVLYVKRIGVKEFDGSEEFYNAGSGYPYALTVMPSDILTGSNVKVLCDRFTNVINTEIDKIDGTGRFCQHASRWYFNYDNQVGGIKAFRNQLAAWYSAGTPMKVMYRLSAPTEIDITDSVLGRELLNIVTAKGTNILEISNAEGLSQNLDITYITHK